MPNLVNIDAGPQPIGERRGSATQRCFEANGYSTQNCPYCRSLERCRPAQDEAERLEAARKAGREVRRD